MAPPKHHTADPGETFEAFFLECAKSGVLPRVELATFSGAAADWRKDDDAVYLRLELHGSHDNDGEPHEAWARLVAPGGFWHIPVERTEVVVLTPPNMEVAGAGWCMLRAQKPPAKLSQERSFIDLPDTVKLLIKAGGWAIRAAAGASVIGVDKDSGEFSITLGGRSFLKWTPNGPQSLPAFEVAIVDTTGTVRTAFRLSADGLEFVTQNAAGTTKQTWAAGADGKFTVFGSGAAQLGWRRGALGTAAVPVQIAIPGGGASLSWYVAGI